jgi:sugar/nucleoside kinase (ribokinase family)
MVVLDCGGRNDEIPSELLSCIDILSPNSSELERIIGSWSSLEEQRSLI